MTKTLSEQQVRFFRHNGFIILLNAISTDTCNDLIRQIEIDLIAEKEPLERSSSGRIRRLSQLFTRDKCFEALAKRPNVINPLTSLLGENIELILNRHNHTTIKFRNAQEPRLHRDIL